MMNYIIKRLIESAILIFSSVLAYWFRFDSVLIPDYYLIPITIFVISASYLLVLESGSLASYAAIRNVRALRILLAIALAGIITATCLYLTKTGESFSRAWLIYCVVISSIALITIRTLAKALISFDRPESNIILIAKEHEVSQLKRAEEQLAVFQIRILATFAPKKHIGNSGLVDMKYAHDFVESQRAKDGGSNAVKEVWISSEIVAEEGEKKIAKLFADSSVELKYLIASPRVIDSRERFISLSNYLVIDTVSNTNIALDLGLKLLLDKTLSLLAIVFLSPFLLLIAILIKIDSKGPIIFRQLRYGVSGIEFPVYKFRTMSHTQENSEFSQATKNDQRITRIGRFLRRSSLDELPQLFNVLTGSMSLVGPRPHPKALNEDHRDVIALYMKRHTVKPGITGLAQIRGFRGETKSDGLMEKRIDSDLEYIRNWSFSLDLKILALTFVHLITTDKAL
jgi:putative colanic acid biosynthesis UDP-glucose lipid carrier transferase